MGKISVSLGNMLRLLFGEVRSGDLRRRRLLAVIQGAVTSLGGKLVGVLVSFLSVPLTIGYLGSERYGAWITMASLLAWLQLTDFGVGNGLTTAVSTAYGQDRPDLVRKHVANAMAMLTVVAALTGVIATVVWPFINWNSLFGLTDPSAQAEIGPAVAVALVIFLLQFPLSVPNRIYGATQEGRIGNYWVIIGSILSLASLLMVSQTKGGLVLLVLAISGTWLLVNIVNAIWLFGWHKPDLAPSLRDIDLPALRALCDIGGKFFLIQIMALVTMQTDTLVISHFLGAAQVPSYSLTYSLFNYTTLPQSIVLSYLWAAYSEAIARNDTAWVRRTFHINLAAGLGFTTLAMIVLVWIAQPFVHWWSGGRVTPPSNLVHWMAAWSLISACTSDDDGT
ncbi:MAG: hypothetical protein EOO61_15525 [Hymenobacter sp.]|nr:MAG: hypothetical protein EOO61_15525 [Hymenobacter sp.]